MAQDNTANKGPAQPAGAPVQPANGKKPLDLNADDLARSQGADTFEEMEKAGRRGSIFGRVSAAFQEKLQTSRGSERTLGGSLTAADNPTASADDLAMRRAKHVTPKRMVVPEGVIIGGSMISGSETEIAGRVEGDVSVEGRLFLDESALITGNVRATSCLVHGLVEGKMECTDELELGRTGRLNASALAGKRFTVSGQVNGNIICGGLLQLQPTANVTGDIETRRLIIEEGATLNGRSSMRPMKERSGK